MARYVPWVCKDVPKLSRCDRLRVIHHPHSSVTKRFRLKLRTILLVDEQDECRLTAKWFLGNFGFVVESARSAEEALAVFDSRTHDLVITDNAMPGMSGLEMAHVIKLR